MAEDLIVWAQSVDRRVKAAKAEEERVKWAFRHALRREIANNEVDFCIKWQIVIKGRPVPVIYLD